MRVALDATPLLGPRTGVGTYVDCLVRALGELSKPPDLTLSPFTVRGAGGLRAARYRARIVHRPFPARALQRLWGATDHPPVEWLASRCDVFHATNFVLPPTRRAASVVTVHDLVFARHADTVTPAVLRYQHLVPRSVARADVVVCPAEATARDVAEYFRLPPERVRVTPLGVDPEWRYATPPPAGWLAARGLPPSYVLFVGAQEPRKGLPWLVAAHTAARAAEPDVVPPLVLAGPSGWGEAIDAPGAHRTGYLADADLRTLVAGASCVVLPSRYEGFGLPLLEAMATGRPVVASDIPVHREITGGLAEYAPVGDVDALAQAIVGACRDDARHTADTRRAWATRWTWRRCAEATLAAYDAALTARN
jgi:glycosyltransferase involved in cell wall biosynthesis